MSEDYKKAAEKLDVPEGYSIEAMIAVGKPGKAEDLPEELQRKEQTKSDRKKVDEFAFEAKFKKL